jgi:hypothetical protein
VPSCLYQDDRTVWLQAGVEVVVEPLVDLVPVRLALGLGSRFHRVVDHDQACTEPGHPRSDADRTEGAALRRLPLGDAVGLALGEGEDRPLVGAGVGRVCFGWFVPAPAGPRASAVGAAVVVALAAGLVLWLPATH